MKKINRKVYISIILTVILFQYGFVGINGFLQSSNTPLEQEKLNTDDIKGKNAPSSSPYYFNLDTSTDLLTEDISSDMNPNSASGNLQSSSYNYYYSDYAISVNLDKYALSGGETVIINTYLTHNLTASASSQISIKIYRGFYRDYYSYYPNLYDAQEIYSTTLITNDKGQASFTFGNTHIDGLYTIFASYNDLKAYKEFTVGEIGIFLKGSKYYAGDQSYRASLAILDISDFSPSPYSNFTYTLERYSYNIDSWENILNGNGQTDEYGYAIFTTPPIYDNTSEYYYYFSSLKLTIHASDGINSASYSTFLYRSWYDYYYTLWGGQQEVNRDNIQYVVTTDKTIYTPGDVIKARSIVLEYSYLNETKIPLGDKLVYITVYSPDELAIYWTTVTTDENGILIFEYSLNRDADIGVYGFEFSLGTDSFRYDIDVQFYTKPVFRVEIDTNGKQFFPRSDSIFAPSIPFEGKIKVNYYFGQPVIGADVDLFIKDYSGTIRLTVSGTTDNNGEFSFSINLDSLENLYWSFFVQSNVTDIYQRTASTEQRYTRMDGLYAYGYLSDWAPEPLDTLQYYFYAYQIMMGNDGYNWDYNALNNVTAKIDVYGVTEYPIIFTTVSNRVKLVSYESTTNTQGSGLLEFSLPLYKIIPYHFFIITLTIELDDGRITEYSTYFRFRKYSLDLQIETPQIYPGDLFEFSATYTDTLIGLPHSGEGRIYIYDADYRLMGRASIEIYGTESFSFEIPNFALEGRYYIYSYVYSRSNNFFGGFNYHSAYETFLVGQTFEITLDSNGTESERNPKEIYVNEGEFLEITGTSNVSSNFPYYFEIYKRGLTTSNRLEVIGNQFSFEIPITSRLGPDFTLMIYTISDVGKLYENHLVIHINYNHSFSLSTDKEIYEPGDTVTLTIKPEGDNPYLLSLSFIDSSLLDVKPEDDSELSYFESNRYYAYIESGSSWGSGRGVHNYWWISYENNQGGPYYYYWPRYYDMEGVYPEMTADEFSLGGKSNPPPPSFDSLLESFDTDIRENISESANWIPSLIISEEINLTFQLPDNIGEWTIRAVGNSIDNSGVGSNGNTLWGDVEYIKIKSFLPFFIEFDIPKPVIQDDIITIKSYVYNYLGTDAQVNVAINASDLVVLNNEIQRILVPNEFVTEVEFSVLCSEAYLNNITILAATTVNGIKYSDAKLLPIYIQPNGIEEYTLITGFLNVTESPLLIDYNLDPLAIYHQESLAIYTDLIDISIDSWKSLVGYPYGCIEQTMSKLLPTALIYNYLNSTDLLTDGLKNEMSLMIMDGLSRVYNFQHLDGGWGWWSDDESKILMSSIVITALNLISDVGFFINPLVLQQGAQFLIDRQNPSGSWAFNYYVANEFEATAFTMKALLTLSQKSSSVNSSISGAIGRLYELWDTIDIKSPYGASLFYISTKNTEFENTTFNSILINYLLSTKQSDGEFTFWSNTHPYYWRNLGNVVEITSYAAWALALDDYLGHYSIIKKSINFLLNRQGRWGWRNTADTSAAILGLTNIKALQSGTEIVDFNGNLSINVNFSSTPQYEVEFEELPVNLNDISLRLSEYIGTGDNQINLSLSGAGQIFYVYESFQILRSNPSITIPEVIDVSTNEWFNISFSGIDARMPLIDTTISFIGLPEIFECTTENYNINIPIIHSEDEFSFKLNSSVPLGEYQFDGILVSGLIQLETNDSFTSSTQNFHKLIGPITIVISEDSLSVDNKQYLLIPKSSYFTQNSPQSSSSSNENLSISKQVSKLTKLMSGDVITVTIEITNIGDSVQFYALDDVIPAGTSLLEDTIKFSGAGMQSDQNTITYDISSSGIHYFIPSIEVGSLIIEYKIQIVSVKNSYFGTCKLWGMYEEVELISDPIIFENIARKYYTNNTVYKDTINPIVSKVEYSQIEGISEMKVQIKFEIEDNNLIEKVRIVYAQNLNWNMKNLQVFENSGEITAIIKNLQNIDSSLDFFIEVIDIYGNIGSSILFPLGIHSIIPFLAIGLSIFLSLGLAGVTTVVLKKKFPIFSRSSENFENNLSFSDEDNELSA